MCAGTGVELGGCRSLELLVCSWLVLKHTPAGPLLVNGESLHLISGAGSGFFLAETQGHPSCSLELPRGATQGGTLVRLV